MLAALALSAALVARYDLHATIEPQQHRMTVTGTIELPPAPATRPYLDMQLPPALDALEVAGAVVEHRDGEVWRVTPPQPFAAGKPVALRVAYRGGGEKPEGLFYVGPETSYSDGAWYPTVRGHMSRGTLAFDVPPDFVVYASGTKRAGANVFDVAVPGDFAFAAGPYRVVRSGDAVAYVLHDRPDVAAHLALCRRILPVLERQFGKYPYRGFALVELPPDKTLFNGAATDGGFMVNGRFLDQPPNLRVYAHELGHEWWGHSIQFSGEGPGDYLLDEALAEYGFHVAARALAPAEAEAWRRRGYPGFEDDFYSALGYLNLNAAGIDQPLLHLAADAPLSDRLARGKAALVFDMLADEVGEERFRATLRRFTREHAHSFITWADFWTAVERGAGRSLKFFSEQWLERTGAPEFVAEGNAIVQRAPYIEVTLPLAGGRRVRVRGARTEVPGGVTAIDPHYRVLRWTPEYRAEAEALVPWVRARALINEGHEEQAEKELRDARPPDRYHARFLAENLLSALLFGKKEWEESRRHAEAALQSVSRRADVLPRVYLRLARIAKELHDDAAMRRAIEQTLAAEELAPRPTGAAEAARALVTPPQ